MQQTSFSVVWDTLIIISDKVLIQFARWPGLYQLFHSGIGLMPVKHLYCLFHFIKTYGRFRKDLYLQQVTASLLQRLSEEVAQDLAIVLGKIKHTLITIRLLNGFFFKVKRYTMRDICFSFRKRKCRQLLKKSLQHCIYLKYTL